MIAAYGQACLLGAFIWPAVVYVNSSLALSTTYVLYATVWLPIGRWIGPGYLRKLQFGCSFHFCFIHDCPYRPARGTVHIMSTRPGSALSAGAIGSIFPRSAGFRTHWGQSSASTMLCVVCVPRTLFNMANTTEPVSYCSYVQCSSRFGYDDNNVASTAPMQPHFYVTKRLLTTLKTILVRPLGLCLRNANQKYRSASQIAVSTTISS